MPFLLQHCFIYSNIICHPAEMGFVPVRHHPYPH
jgi:hypothetical protein